MENSFFHKLSRTLWRAILVLIVMLAAYVGLGQVMMANLSGYRTAILQELNVRLPFSIEARQIHGQWNSFSPVVVLTGLRVTFPDGPKAPVELSEGRVGIDVLNSLRTLTLKVTRVSLTNLTLAGNLSREGKLSLTGLGLDGGEVGESGLWLRDFLLNVERVTLKNNVLLLTLPGGEERNFDLDLLLLRDGSHRRLDATLASTSGLNITVLADGVGDPLRPDGVSAEVYLNIETPDLGALSALIPGRIPSFWAEGAVHLELWLALDDGLPSLDARLDARDLVVVDENMNQRFPLERLALQANLVERRNQWTLYGSDLRMEQDGIELVLPNLQLDVWGSALRIRVADVPLADLNALVVGSELLPQNLREIFSELNPRGRLSTLQLGLGDFENPQADWEVEADFEEVAVDSYKGAPGVLSAEGYTRIIPTGGIVLLDSAPLTLNFPGVFQEPLFFDDLYGTLEMAWDANNFGLSSGLITAQGEEGRARALFALNVPLTPTEVGVTMDLMVGLENSQLRFRDKYIPYTLSESLLQWLSASIGDGRIEQGAFLWRGSLKADAAPLRTVQLAFNVAEAPMEYHPDWPSVVVDQGRVFIDDSSVSVWADGARLLNSLVRQMSVETRLDDAGHLLLDISGSLAGPAADGLHILNNSALTKTVGNAFADWSLTGDLEADLLIGLDLTDNTVPPAVDVKTRWRDVDVMIVPGNLPFDALQGDLRYSTDKGFQSSRMEGELWGSPLRVNLKQSHQGSGRYNAGTSGLQVSIVSGADMADVRRWLDIDLLGLAKGRASLKAAVSIMPGEPPQLDVDSMLEGVALDLPSPWKKGADTPQRFHLEMPLAGGVTPLTLELGDQLTLDLSLSDGRLQGGALGVNVPPPERQPQVFAISGHASLVAVDEWLTFVAKYLGAAELYSDVVAPDNVAPDNVATTSEKVSAPVTGESAVIASETQLPLRIVINKMQADELVFGGQRLDNAEFSVSLEDSAWDIVLNTDWLRGALSLSRNGDPSQLNIEYLDIGRLSELESSSSEEGATPFDFPLMEVNLQSLMQSDRRLGNLKFNVHSAAGILTAEQITGEMAGFDIAPQRPARLVWHQGEEGYTQLQAPLSFADLGDTLEYFGYERIVRTANGSFGVDINWPGAPQDFSLETGKGSVNVKIGPGSFLNVPTGTSGALRVVSVLNLADIVRRLSLAHMFDEGIPFERVKGEVFLRDGTIEVARMDMQGSSSFRFSGVSNVQARNLSGELVATLPVANNLAWVAALAASLPIAAGVFVVSQVFSKQMSILSSAVYSIGGTWNEPVVEFDRIFDDTPAPSAEPAAPTTD